MGVSPCNLSLVLFKYYPFVSNYYSFSRINYFYLLSKQCLLGCKTCKPSQYQISSINYHQHITLIFFPFAPFFINSLMVIAFPFLLIFSLAFSENLNAATFIFFVISPLLSTFPGTSAVSPSLICLFILAMLASTILLLGLESSSATFFHIMAFSFAAKTLSSFTNDSN